MKNFAFFLLPTLLSENEVTTRKRGNEVTTQKKGNEMTIRKKRNEKLNSLLYKITF
jgi:hypothetical protein